MFWSIISLIGTLLKLESLVSYAAKQIEAREQVQRKANAPVTNAEELKAIDRLP